jgi:hypothetical protein
MNIYEQTTGILSLLASGAMPIPDVISNIVRDGPDKVPILPPMWIFERTVRTHLLPMWIFERTVRTHLLPMWIFVRTVRTHLPPMWKFVRTVRTQLPPMWILNHLLANNIIHVHLFQ